MDREPERRRDTYLQSERTIAIYLYISSICGSVSTCKSVLHTHMYMSMYHQPKMRRDPRPACFKRGTGRQYSSPALQVPSDMPAHNRRPDFLFQPSYPPRVNSFSQRPHKKPKVTPHSPICSHSLPAHSKTRTHHAKDKKPRFNPR